MKKIPLTQGKFAIVDDEDYDWLNHWTWSTSVYSSACYATRNLSTVEGQRSSISMHRQLMGLERGDGRFVDHCNHDGLDNRKSNLRLCTSQENLRNLRPHRDSSSKYKGVTWDKSRGTWKAGICIEGKTLFLGRYNDETQAAMMYDNAAHRAFGAFAWLNFREGAAV